MARKRKTFRSKVIKTVKALSRVKYGRPGLGRKTKFKDMKKHADITACRKRDEHED